MRRFSLAAATLLLAGCTSASPETPLAGGAGGAGGGGGGSCADLGASGSCRFQGSGNGCAVDEVCTVSAHPSCGAASCCTLPVSCEPRTGVEAPGFSCEEDADCASGLCVVVGGVGSCLRSCDGSVGPDELPAWRGGPCASGCSGRSSSRARLVS